jgi:hypothetical protein
LTVERRGFPAGRPFLQLDKRVKLGGQVCSAEESIENFGEGFNVLIAANAQREEAQNLIANLGSLKRRHRAGPLTAKSRMDSTPMSMQVALQD